MGGIPLDPSTCPCQHAHLDALPPRSARHVSIRCSDRLDQASVARLGRCPRRLLDDAMAEALHEPCKVEPVKLHGPWPTTADIGRATIDWYNARRLHGGLGDVPRSNTKPPGVVPTRPSTAA